MIVLCQTKSQMSQSSKHLNSSALSADNIQIPNASFLPDASSLISEQNR